MNEKVNRFYGYSLGLCCFLFDSLLGVAPKQVEALDIQTSL